MIKLGLDKVKQRTPQQAAGHARRCLSNFLLYLMLRPFDIEFYRNNDLPFTSIIYALNMQSTLCRYPPIPAAASCGVFVKKKSKSKNSAICPAAC
jgi:hypothetical protein